MPLRVGDAFVSYRYWWRMNDQKIRNYLDAHSIWREIYARHPESLWVTFELTRVELLIKFLVDMVDLEKYYEPIQQGPNAAEPNTFKSSFTDRVVYSVLKVNWKWTKTITSTPTLRSLRFAENTQ